MAVGSNLTVVGKNFPDKSNTKPFHEVEITGQCGAVCAFLVRGGVAAVLEQSTMIGFPGEITATKLPPPRVSSAELCHLRPCAVSL
jgi:hypothetical protein